MSKVLPPYRGALGCAVKAVQNGGAMAVYKGFVPTITCQGPYVVVLFLSFEQMKLEQLSSCKHFQQYSCASFPRFGKEAFNAVHGGGSKSEFFDSSKYSIGKYFICMAYPVQVMICMFLK